MDSSADCATQPTRDTTTGRQTYGHSLNAAPNP